MGEKLKKLRDILNALTGYDPRRNADGTMTTKHGNRIIPYKITVTHNGGMHANVVEFMFQPRVRELEKQMAPLLAADHRERLVLDPDTGNFYLNGDIERNGIAKATPLGQIDLDLEQDLFRAAAQAVGMEKLFHGASHDNPIVLDEGTGRVYPQNNPDETRGYVKLGETVSNTLPPADKKKSGLIDLLFGG